MLEELTESQQFKLLRQLLEMAERPQNNLTAMHQDLTEAGIEYCVIGGLCLIPHNYERATQDIDILVSKSTANNLTKLHGLGYNLRPGATNNMFMYGGIRKIPIDVLIEGQLQNGFIMPNPKVIRQKINGIWYASLPALISLKLQANRTQDIADVHKLIELNELDINFANQLSLNVQEKFKGLF